MLSRIPVVPISRSIAEESVRLQTRTGSLGRGEREAIAFCQVEGAKFATNDSVARRFAQAQGVEVISLQALLRGLWVTGICSRTEVKALLEQIKNADNLTVSEEVENEIFSQNEGNTRL